MSFHFLFYSYVPFPWLKLELFITGCWFPPPPSKCSKGRQKSSSVVCNLFLYSFICAPTTAFTWLSKVWTSQFSRVFYQSWDLSWCRVSFLKADLQFSKLFKNKICKRVCTLKCTEKRFIPFTPSPPIFSLSLSLTQNLNKALNMSPGMYCIIRL
jgi:hypothetical protein